MQAEDLIGNVSLKPSVPPHWHLLNEIASYEHHLLMTGRSEDAVSYLRRILRRHRLARAFFRTPFGGLLPVRLVMKRGKVPKGEMRELLEMMYPLLSESGRRKAGWALQELDDGASANCRKAALTCCDDLVVQGVDVDSLNAAAADFFDLFGHDNRV
jgi:hypothetical protein